jgi:hypothetical protein
MTDIQNAPAVEQVAGSLNYRVSWPRPATPCNLQPLWKGEFVTFGDWVNFATTRLTGTTDERGVDVSAICVDALGRRCSIGAHFMRARDEDAFPVRYFWECTPAQPEATGNDGAGLRELEAEATQGEWRANEHDGSIWIDADEDGDMPVALIMSGSPHNQDCADAAFILAAVAHVRAVLAAQTADAHTPTREG